MFLRAGLISAIFVIAAVVWLIRRPSEDDGSEAGATSEHAAREISRPNENGWSEPAYGEKPLTEWLAICHTGSPPARVEAEEGIRKIGNKAIPVLLDMLRAHDSDLKVRALKFARSHQSVIKIEGPLAGYANVCATHGFRVLGSNAVDAVPELIRIFDENISSSSQSQTAVALLWIGPPAQAAVPSLLRGVSATNSDRAVPSSRTAAAIRTVRFNSIWALGQIHAEPKKVLPVLTNAFRDPDPGIRKQAIFSVVNFGTDAREMVPAISGLLSDPDQQVRDTAQWALARPFLDPNPAGSEKQSRATNTAALPR